MRSADFYIAELERRGLPPSAEGHDRATAGVVITLLIGGRTAAEREENQEPVGTYFMPVLAQGARYWEKRHPRRCT